MSKKKKKIITTSICPKCNQIMSAKDTYCLSCGYVKNNNKKNFNMLYFGNKITEKTEAKENEILYSTSTKGITTARKIYNIIFALLGVFNIFLLVLPLFPLNNVYTQYDDISSYYHYIVNDTLLLDKQTNLIGLFKNVINYLKLDAFVAHSSMILFAYEIIVILFTTTMIVLGIILLLMTIFGLSKNDFVHKIKKVNGVLFAFSLTMIFAFNCYSITYIIHASFCLLAYLILYIGEIITKEKTIYLKQVILKSIAIVIMLVILIFSSSQLIEVNVTLGAKLYRYESIGATSNYSIMLKGFFIDVVQSIQCSSGDDSFVLLATVINYLKVIMHIAFVIIIIFSLISLIKSFPSQVTKFPLTRILISTVLFYGFIILLGFYNQLVNDASLNLYIEQIGIKEFTLLSDSAKLNAEKINRVFILKPGFYIATILYLPMCVYSFIANKICFEKTYY
ncbi:MAG: hypothetical protein MR270_04735 [Erysipelotrichaceae bacterium]|nr:hypothetical protein [Erysipelotrichaceae bacterium]